MPGTFPQKARGLHNISTQICIRREGVREGVIPSNMRVKISQAGEKVADRLVRSGVSSRARLERIGHTAEVPSINKNQIARSWNI